jgi:hypothetical protein
VRVVTTGPIDEHHPHTVALEFLHDHHLVHEVAGQPVRRADQYQVEGCLGRLVA